MKRFSEFLRIIVFFWRSRLSIDAKKKEKDGEKIECAHTRWRVRKDALLDLSVACAIFVSWGVGGWGVGYPLHLDHSIAFYAGGFMSNYLSHFEVMRVFIEHNEHFEIQGIDQ